MMLGLGSPPAGGRSRAAIYGLPLARRSKAEPNIISDTPTLGLTLRGEGVIYGGPVTSLDQESLPGWPHVCQAK